MHERSIIRQLLGQVEKLMNDHQAHSVSAVHVSIGEFSGVDPMLIKSAYDEMVDYTPFRGAELVIDAVPLEGFCNRCEHQFLVEQFSFLCPACHGREIRILRGEDLMLETVVMEGEES